MKDDVKVMITYQGTKPLSRFQVKHQTELKHRNNVVYCCKYHENDYDDFYNGKTDRRISERTINHNKKDKNSHLLQHAQSKKHEHIWVNDFTILYSIIGLKLREK